MKKTVSLFLSILMLVTLFPFSALAEEETAEPLGETATAVFEIEDETDDEPVETVESFATEDLAEGEGTIRDADLLSSSDPIEGEDTSDAEPVEQTETEAGNNSGEEPCEHLNTCEDFEEIGVFEYSEIEGDDVNHIAVHTVATIEFCTDCGQQLSYTLHYEDIPEPHQYQDGVCTACGHVYGCTHQNAYSTGEFVGDITYSEIAGDQIHHIGTGTFVTYWYCPDCGKWETLSEETIEELWEHAYDENGVCAQCGHVFVCEHQNTYEMYGEVIGDPEYSEIEGDNLYHFFAETIPFMTYCSDCGQQLSYVVCEDAGVQPHNYVDGVCTLCGHANTCEHLNAYDHFEYEDEIVYSEIPDNDVYHQGTGKGTVWHICPDCGLREALYEETRSEEMVHEYDGTNICMWCGHVSSICDHLNADDEWGWVGDPIYTDIEGNNREHSVSYRYATWRYCPDCGERLDYFEHDDLDTSTAPHNYNGTDTCQDCGHVNTCEHPNAYEERMVIGDVVFAEIEGNNANHLASYRYATAYYCPDCGRQFDYQEHDDLWTEEQGHSYDENGICINCGHVNTCEHPNAYEERMVIGDVVFTEIEGNNANHLASYRYATAYYCPDCGRRFDYQEHDDLWTEEQGHSYDENGICVVCGHVNTCEHLNAYEQRWSIGEIICVEVEGDNASHHHAYRYATGYYCPDCGLTLDYQEHDDLWVEDYYYCHTYDENGICTDCGHVNTCEHPNLYETRFLIGDIFYTEIEGDDVNHLASYRYASGYACPDCGMTFDYQEQDDLWSEAWHHSYDDTGTCVGCGHVNACEHPNAWEEYGKLGEYFYEEIEGNNSYHLECYYYYTQQYCPDCEARFDYCEHDDIIKNRTVHLYYEDGICNYCGHVNTCEHVNVYESWTFDGPVTYTEIEGNNLRHQASGRYTSQRYCNDCAQWLDDYPIEHDDLKVVEWSHEYDENGICQNCGHVNTCEHANIEEDWYWNNPPEYSEIEGDEGYHLVTGFYAIDRFCPDCGLWFDSIEPEEPKTVIERHEYDETGKCWLCGHICTCEHINAYDNWGLFYDAVYTEIEGDNAHHIASGRYWTARSCPDCNQQLDYTEHDDIMSKTCGHEYDKNGVCSQCGHVNTCEHLNAFENWWFLNDAVYTEIEGDNADHIVSGRYWTARRCPDCDQQLDYIEHDDIRTGTYNHSYNENGICVDCGHVNTCEHLNAHEDWWFLGDMTYSEIEGDNTHHIASGRYWTARWCPDCEQQFDYIEHDDIKTGTYDHSYNANGVCMDCGHVNTCEHLNAYEEWWFIGNLTYSEIEGDNAHHIASGRYWTARWCPDCNQQLDYTEHDDLRVETWSHDYDDNGVCWDCGHVNTCTHSNGMTRSWSSDGSWTEDTGNNRYHLIREHLVEKYDLCPDCGMKFNVVPCDEWVFRYDYLHEYDGNGVCRWCGHVNTCEHKNISRYFRATGETKYKDDGNGKTHSRIVDGEIVSYCSDCGASCGSTQISNVIQNGMNHWFENGICQECGYVNTCAHDKGVNTDRYGDATDIISYDDHGHTFCGYTEYTYCSTCGEYLSSAYITDEFTEQHLYEDCSDICFKCGYVNPTSCTHEHTYDYLYWVAITEIHADTEDGHTRSGYLQPVTWCEDCQRAIAFGDLTEGTYVQPHTMINGSCIYCGHKHAYSNGACICGEHDLSFKPVLVSTTITASGITVTWKAVDKAEAYRVFRKEGSGGWKKLADTTSLTYTDKTAVSGTKYSYTVRCVTADGTTFTSSYDSTGLSATFIAAPVLSSVTNAANGVTIKWTASDGAELYRVYRKTGTGSWTKLGDTTGVTYTDKTAVSGTKYSYTVRCLSADGKAFTSAYDTAGLSVTYIEAPVLSSVTNVASGVTIKWTASDGAEAYRVFRKEGTGSWKKLADTTSLSYTDKTAVSGTKYSYTVRCVTADGKTATSAYDTAGLSVTYITAPELSSVTNTTSGVTVKWAASDEAEAYRVFRKEGAGSWKKLGDTTALSYADKTAVSGTDYAYTVRCVSADGQTFTSAYNTTGLSVKYIAAPALSSVTNTTSGVTIKWTASNGAEAYRVFRKEGTGSWKKLADTTGSSYTDKTAVSGTKYSYTVRCVTADGKTFTSAYNTAGLSVTFIAAPALSSVTNTTGGITVKWTASSGAEAYRVFRKEGTGGWKKLADTTALSYTDKTAVSGTKYSYTVRCVTADGKTFTSAYDTTGLSIVKK